MINKDDLNYEHGLLNDKWASSIVFPNLVGGYFVEAGACAGKAGSATYFLEKYLDWKGICVEPIPSLYEKIPAVRDCHSINSCLYSESDIELKFTVFSAPEKKGYSGISEINKNLNELKSDKSEEIITSSITLHDLLKLFDAPTTIHYLALDTEGSEREIISSFNFDGEYKILAISIEGHECDDILIKNGYIPILNPFTDKKFESYFVHESLKKNIPSELILS